jgi:hypothetical protein
MGVSASTDRERLCAMSPEEEREPPNPPPQTVRRRLFGEGVQIIRGLTGLDDRAARTVIGLLLRDARDDALRVLEAIQRAGALQPGEAISWLRAAVKAQTKREEHRGC